jgi:hypothetical protein
MKRKERGLALVASGMKKCSACKETKALESFYKVKTVRYGYSAYCKQCNSQKGKERFSRPEVKAKTKLYYSRDDIKERGKQRETLTPRYAISRARAKALGRRPTEGAVSLDYLMEMYEANHGLCEVSGFKMTWSTGDSGRKPTSISIDRINSSKGYVAGNVRLVCWQVNAFKGNWTDEQMFTMALALVANMKPKLRLVS